jgi:hypothetical protein
MELKQNINRVHGDLTNYFENVQISEKSNKELGNYFELSVLENNKEIKAIIKMTEIENDNFSWNYYANPLDENSLVERVSSIYTFSSDVQDIFEKNRFSSDYINKVNEDVSGKFIGFNVLEVIESKSCIKLIGESLDIVFGCSGGATVDCISSFDNFDTSCIDKIKNEIISEFNTSNEYEVVIKFESGHTLELSDSTGGEGIEFWEEDKN